MAVGLIAIGIMVVLLAVFLIGIYNILVKLRQRVQNSWSQVDVQLKRRYDLIPNLVNAVSKNSSGSGGGGGSCYGGRS